MNTSELDELCNDVQETLAEVGVAITVQRLQESNKNMYQESKKKVYSAGVAVVGYPKLTPKPEELSEIGQRKGATLLVTVSYNELVKAGFLTNNEIVLTDKDRIVFQCVEYDILNVYGSGFVSGRCVIYKFECIKET